MSFPRVTVVAVAVAACIGGSIAAQTGSKASQKQATLSISATVVPSCAVETSTTDAGKSAVTMRCQSADLNRARVNGGTVVASPSAQPRTTYLQGSSAVARTDVQYASLVQIDF